MTTLGAGDIYRSRRSGGVHLPPENLGPVINSDVIEHAPFIAPDESYLIFSSSGHGAQAGNFHFLITHGTPDGDGSQPMPLDRITAPPEQSPCPLVTAGGEFMSFIGSRDIWWTRANFIEAMRSGR